MKFGACYCLYDDHEYLDLSLQCVEKYLDKVIFLISNIPWNGKKSDNSKTIEHVKKLCARNPKFELHFGDWDNEVVQRNYGLELFYKEGIDYYFLIDTDELYHQHEFERIIQFIKICPQFSAFHIEWNTYWSKDYFKIWPREGYRPVICVKTDSFQFNAIRHGTTAVKRTEQGIIETDGEYNGVIIPPEVGICYHLSYARDDQYMQRKLETNSHAPEFIQNWYENIWKRWTPQMQNLHPVTPEQYQQAVPEDLAALPLPLQHFIVSEKSNS
ncbi:MAG: hypothetical protein H6619_05660 [Deltaproteobacteria bacterium]|nr:hypothetical protein [Deltaproteobacteria bacterium]